jgi:outer membrane lipoprotein SlyB
VSVHVGDRIKVESERAGQTARAGTIEQVLSDDPTRLRIRWDDGHTTVMVPAAGSAQIEPAARRGKSKA